MVCWLTMLRCCLEILINYFTLILVEPGPPNSYLVDLERKWRNERGLDWKLLIYPHLPKLCVVIFFFHPHIIVFFFLVNHFFNVIGAWKLIYTNHILYLLIFLIFKQKRFASLFFFILSTKYTWRKIKYFLSPKIQTNKRSKINLVMGQALVWPILDRVVIRFESKFIVFKQAIILKLVTSLCYLGQPLSLFLRHKW